MEAPKRVKQARGTGPGPHPAGQVMCLSRDAHWHELFDDLFQQELAELYQPSERGHPPVTPAQLALATIVQAYMGVSDDEVIEATLMDRRWQLVLDCLDIDQAPWSQRNVRRRALASHRRPDGSTAHRTDH